VTLRFTAVAVISLVAAVALTGCGRKGPLDPPPGAAPTPAPASTKPASGASLNPMAPAETGDKKRAEPPVFTSAGKPVAITAPKRPLPMDWLLE
jgi:predicted small lipoprotein YifL